MYGIARWLRSTECLPRMRRRDVRPGAKWRMEYSNIGQNKMNKVIVAAIDILDVRARRRVAPPDNEKRL